MRAWALAALVACSGCGPALHTLVSGNHLREVTCAGEDGVGGAAAALDAKAGAVVHVQVVPDETLVRQLGAARGPAVAGRARLVRVRVSTNALPLDSLSLTARLLSADGQGTAPANWAALSWATGEALPRPRTTTTVATTGNALGVLASVFTVGLAALVWPWDSAAVELPPLPEDYARVSPLTNALREGLGEAGCRGSALGGAGQLCTFDFVVDRQVRGPFWLEVSSTYEAQRDGGDHEAREQCHVTSTRRVELGPLEPGPGAWTRLAR